MVTKISTLGYPNRFIQFDRLWKEWIKALIELTKDRNENGLCESQWRENVCTINEHIKNIFDEVELLPESVIRKFRITTDDGRQYNTRHYNTAVIRSTANCQNP